MKLFSRLVICLVLGLAGCQTIDTGRALQRVQFLNARAATQAEKDILILVMRNTLADPSSVRDAEISTVITDTSNIRMVCIRGNAKNLYGAYTGVSTKLVYINTRDIAFKSAEDTFSNDICRKLQFTPFVMPG
jgi:hypothetical protein